MSPLLRSVAVAIAVAAAAVSTAGVVAAVAASPSEEAVPASAAGPVDVTDVVVRYGEPGGSPTEIVSMTASADVDPAVIERLYRAYFLRPADPGGLDHWVRHWKAGYPLDSISNDFAKADEFRGRYGTVSDRDFVTLVYRNVLDRKPDAGGYEYWTSHLRAGLTRGQLMMGFSESPEFKSKKSAPKPTPTTTTTTQPAARPTTTQPQPPAYVDPSRYSYLFPNNGNPIGWRPCTPVRVTVNPDGAPGNVDFGRALTSALGKISAATGVRWTLEAGTPARQASPDALTVNPGGVEIFYTTSWPAGDGAVGYGYAWYRSESAADGTRESFINGGTVALKASWHPSSQAQLESLLLHELGHVAGLHHVDHDDEVMNPNITDRTSYGTGDRHALGTATRISTVC